MIRFYAPDIAATLTLPESDSQHAIKVLRHTVGDMVEVTDGRGTVYTCRIVDPHPRRTGVEIVERAEVKPCWDFHITIAVAPTKSIDRMEWLVEKLTETGVDRIVPVFCRYSERKEIKTDRLRRVAVAAMKQSLKATLPEIAEMTPIADFLASCTADQRFMGYCDDSVPRRLLAAAVQLHRSAAVLIGPEGDFSPAEVEQAIAAGFTPVTMGDNRLRTETAALVACDTLHIVNQLSPAL